VSYKCHPPTLNKASSESSRQAARIKAIPNQTTLPGVGMGPGDEVFPSLVATSFISSRLDVGRDSPAVEVSIQEWLGMGASGMRDGRGKGTT